MSKNSIVIAGAGPVGMTLGLVLGAEGIPVTVLEAGEDLSAVSRASTVHASTLELFDELGVAWDVIAAGECIHRVQYRDRKDGVIAEFPMDVMSDYTKFPIRMQTDQSEITRIIRRRFASLPSVSLLYGRRVTAVAQDDDGVRVTCETDGGQEVFEGAYAVGADGAHSAVRSSLGIEFPGERYPSRYMMVLTTFDVLGAMPEMAPVTYISDQDEGTGILSLPGHVRVVFHLHPDEDADEARSPANVQARLRGFLPPHDGDYPVLDVLVYSLHRRLAETLRRGRVVLAGDAAHLNNPSGGMGMNSGIHDAYALGKVLVGIERGDAGDAALDGYAHARRSVARGYIHVRSDRNWRESEASNAEQKAKRDERLRRAASSRALMRDFVLKASMFDTAPRVLW